MNEGRKEGKDCNITGRLMRGYLRKLSNCITKFLMSQGS